MLDIVALIAYNNAMSRTYKGRKDRLLFQKKHSIAFLVFILVCIFVALIAYAFFEDRQVRVRQQTVTLPSLPRAFEGYTFALISDLNGREFGNGQETLLSTLSPYKYDAVLLAGDMAGKDFNTTAFLELLDGLAPLGKPMYFVPGETDPPLYEVYGGVVRPTPFYEALTERGVTYLEVPVKIERSGAAMWLSPGALIRQDPEAALQSIDLSIQDISSNTFLTAAEVASRTADALHKKDVFTQYKVLRDEMTPENAHLVLAHYPMTTELAESLKQYEGTPLDIDMVFAGHYIGGRHRVPLLGAVYIDVPSFPRNGFFPPQRSVMGLNEISGIQQYISPGLGARKGLRIRLFNAPVIPLIRLSYLWQS